jgi:hypothetical protein
MPSNLLPVFPSSMEEASCAFEARNIQTVLRWLEHGFVPNFQGTSEAEPQKREAVKAMLGRVLTAEQINQSLDAKQPEILGVVNGYRCTLITINLSTDLLTDLCA